MTLTNPTDEQLNAAFAEKVCGWRYDFSIGDKAFMVPGLKSREVAIPNFTHSVDAVLPWLENDEFVVDITRAKGPHSAGWKLGWWVRIISLTTNEPSGDWQLDVARAARLMP